MQNPQTIALASEHWQLRLQPDIGVQILSCQAKSGEHWHDVMPDCTQENAELKSSNFHMVPYSNRIRDGKFIFHAQQVQLEGADQHAIHGALRKLPWRVLEQSETELLAAYDTRQDGAVNWPWPISAEVRYTLDSNKLISHMSLTNEADSPMPAGMGWHPYFCRHINDAEPTLTIPVTGVYPDTNGDCLPVDTPIALPEELDFRKEKSLNADVRIDHCMAGLKSPVHIRWPAAGINLSMRTSENCTHLVLFNPDKPFFAVEPVTNANDAVNLESRGIAAGLIELEPGEQLKCSMEIVLEV